MTDRRSSVEGLQPSSRHRSPPLNDTQYHFESLNRASAGQPAGTSRTRRRPSRTNSGSKTSPESASPPWEDANKENVTRSKGSRNILKKPPRRDSVQDGTSGGSDVGSYQEEDISAFIPKLGRIREGQVSRTSSSRASSTVSSSVESKPRRRRHTEDHGLSGSRLRHESGSVRQRAEEFVKQTTPSALSGSSQQSSRSSGSNSTATKTSHDYTRPTAERRSSNRPAGSDQPRGSRMSTPAQDGDVQSNVFQFMQESPSMHYVGEDAHNMPSSTPASSASATSSDSEEDEMRSSYAESSQLGDTPTTSPASTRRSNPDASHKPRGYKSGVPLYASSFVHGHGGSEGEEEEGDDSGTEEDSEVESDEGEGESEDADDGGSHHAGHNHMQQFALQKAPPPRAPSPSAAPSDPRSARLRQQEQELANHVLQSPQPHKDFQFAGAPSPEQFPSMPMYSPRAYSGAPPASYEATANYPPEWPPFPPPPQIGYTTQGGLESPTAGRALPLTVQPPMGVSGPPVHQHGAPFQTYPGQPPHYQAQVSAPDASRTTVAGYELLANKLCETPKGKTGSKRAGQLVPMYRKFEHLNHRVLLHLQDEVCELEEELRYLDESIIQTSPKDEAGQVYPASRRGDAQYGSELHYKRTELLGRIFQKLGQYNQALTAFNSLLKELEPASAEDIQAYRTWMEKRLPIDRDESRFLERKQDLLAVSRRPSTTTTSLGHQQSEYFWFPLILVLPLLAFAIVPSLLGRLVVIALISAAELKLVTTTPELMGLMSMQAWSAAASAYIGSMALLACLVR